MMPIPSLLTSLDSLPAQDSALKSAGLVGEWEQARDREQFVAALLKCWPRDATRLRFGLVESSRGGWIVSLKCDWLPPHPDHPVSDSARRRGSEEQACDALTAHLHGWSDERASPLWTFTDVNALGDPPLRTRQEWAQWALAARAPGLAAWCEARQLEKSLPTSGAELPRLRL